MRKISYGAFVVSLVLVFFSCRPKATDRSQQIDEVNYWYSYQLRHPTLSKDSVRHYVTLIENGAKELPSPYKAMVLICKARYYSNSNPDLSLKFYQEAVDLLQPTGVDSLMARAYNGIGVRYIKQSDFSNALEYYFKALKLYEKQDDKESIGGVLSNIGEVYQVKNDIPLAKRYILRAMQVNKEADNISSYLDAAQTLANMYGMNNQFDSAIAIDRMGIAMADSIGSTRLKSSFFNNLGNCYMYSDRPDSARHYFTQCVALDSANGLMHFMVDNYLTLGQLSLQQKESKAAEQYFKRAIKLSDSVGEKQLKAQAWNGLATLYKQQENLALALVARDSATAVKDRIINEKSENKIAELQQLYETEKKEQTISLQQLKLSRQRLLLIGSVVLFSSLLLSGWLIYRRYRINKEKELQASIMQQREKATLDILQAEDKERRRIAAELHDGVGQVILAAWMNLQAMEPQMNDLPPAQQQALSRAISMVGEGCKEVREVSHAMMPNALLNKGLVGALKDFTQQIDNNVLSINLHTEGMDMPIDGMVETILYRVIQESVNNTLKHAGARELDITIDNHPAGISLLIEDNGKGFDSAALLSKKNGHDGLGLQNIQSRIAFLQGTVEWDSSPGNGTVVTIFIPAKKTHE